MRISCLTLEKELSLTLRTFLYMPRHPVMEVWVGFSYEFVTSFPFIFLSPLFSIVLFR